MVKYTFRPKKIMQADVQTIAEHINTELLRQNEELRRVLDSVYKDLEDLKRRG